MAWRRFVAGFINPETGEYAWPMPVPTPKVVEGELFTQGFGWQGMIAPKYPPDLSKAKVLTRPYRTKAACLKYLRMALKEGRPLISKRYQREREQSPSRSKKKVIGGQIIISDRTFRNRVEPTDFYAAPFEYWGEQHKGGPIYWYKGKIWVEEGFYDYQGGRRVWKHLLTPVPLSAVRRYPSRESKGTFTVQITKDPKRGWHYKAVVYRAGWAPATTYGKSRTLASALLDTVGRLSTSGLELTSLTVKGKPMTKAEAYRIIEKDLKGTILDYKLPELREALLGSRLSPQAPSLKWEPHTYVYVDEYPKCDFCSRQAHYDGRTIFGPWAYMCDRHFRQYGVGLGLGKGQRLLLRREHKKQFPSQARKITWQQLPQWAKEAARKITGQKMVREWDLHVGESFPAGGALLEWSRPEWALRLPNGKVYYLRGAFYDGFLSASKIERKLSGYDKPLTLTLPPGGQALRLEHICMGGRCYWSADFYIRPEDVAQIEGGGKAITGTEELTPAEILVLVATRSLVSKARWQELNRYLNRDQIHEAVESLIAKKLLTKSRAITARGKNALVSLGYDFMDLWSAAKKLGIKERPWEEIEEERRRRFELALKRAREKGKLGPSRQQSQIRLYKSYGMALKRARELSLSEGREYVPYKTYVTDSRVARRAGVIAVLPNGRPSIYGVRKRGYGWVVAPVDPREAERDLEGTGLKLMLTAKPLYH